MDTSTSRDDWPKTTGVSCHADYESVQNSDVSRIQVHIFDLLHRTPITNKFGGLLRTNTTTAESANSVLAASHGT